MHCSDYIASQKLSIGLFDSKLHAIVEVLYCFFVFFLDSMMVEAIRSTLRTIYIVCSKHHAGDRVKVVNAVTVGTR